MRFADLSRKKKTALRALRVASRDYIQALENVRAVTTPEEFGAVSNGMNALVGDIFEGGATVDGGDPSPGRDDVFDLVNLVKKR